MQVSGFVRCFSLALLVLVIPISSYAGVLVSVAIAPPVLPVYTQPACPGDGYIWTPGYWAYSPEGYYWVPGTWVQPPAVGLLWTPGYWGWSEGVYVWHAGYWGPHIGFYGGLNYGYGYFGTGYVGGYWQGPHFYYNRTVNNVTIANVHIYNRTMINNETMNRVSYNGGAGGVNARPSHEQESWGRERHFEPTRVQVKHEDSASRNRAFLVSENHGRPAIAATARPGEFHGREVVATRHEGGFNRPVEDRLGPRPPNPHHDAEYSAPHQSAHGSQGPPPEHNNPRWSGATRPSSYYPDPPHTQRNPSQRENGSHSNKGHEQR